MRESETEFQIGLRQIQFISEKRQSEWVFSSEILRLSDEIGGGGWSIALNEMHRLGLVEKSINYIRLTPKGLARLEGFQTPPELQAELDAWAERLSV